MNREQFLLAGTHENDYYGAGGSMDRMGYGLRRLAEDRQLSLIVLVCTVICVFILPLAVARWLLGNYLVAIIDAALVLVSVVAAVYAWRSGNTRRPSLAMAMIITAGAILVPYFVGLSGAVWLFPVSLFVFYMVSPWVALVLMTVTLISLAVQTVFGSVILFPTITEILSFFSAATSTIVFSFFFALHANRQKAQLVRWATRDPLTGLYNRRALEEELRIALATRDRGNNPLHHGLTILDLDQFKHINDQFGHAVGDDVLRKLAVLIERSTRAEDRAFRYGGDEFVILLTDTDRAGVTQFAEKLVRKIAEEISTPGMAVTASAGAALLTPEDTQESWNQRADRCLYNAKERGRNQAVTAEDPAETA